MRNKVLFLILALLMFAAPVHAYDKVEVAGADIEIKEVVNSSGDFQSEAIDRNTIVHGRDRILGFTISVYDPGDATTAINSELIAGLYDAVPDGSGGTIAELIAEAEADNNTSKTKWFPYPKTVHFQLVVNTGANTLLQIYYVRN